VDPTQVASIAVTMTVRDFRATTVYSDRSAVRR
jgi:hypothetical protein